MMTVASTRSWEQFNEAGRRYFSAGDLARAEEAFRGAIAHAEAIGPEAPQLASSLSNLGQLKYQQRDFDAADELFRRALAIRERHPTHDPQGLAHSINNLAALRVARGDLVGAEPLLQRAVTLSVSRGAAGELDLAVNLNNLAKLYFKKNDLAQAEPLLERVLLLKRKLGQDHPEVAAVLTSLAKVRATLGRHAEAERTWNEVLQIRVRTLPPTDPALATAYENLADACAAQGNYQRAIELREHGLAIRESTLGAGHATLAPLRAYVDELRARFGRPAAPAAPAPHAIQPPAPPQASAPEPMPNLIEEPLIAKEQSSELLTPSRAPDEGAGSATYRVEEVAPAAALHAETPEPLQEPLAITQDTTPPPSVYEEQPLAAPLAAPLAGAPPTPPSSDDDGIWWDPNGPPPRTFAPARPLTPADEPSAFGNVVLPNGAPTLGTQAPRPPINAYGPPASGGGSGRIETMDSLLPPARGTSQPRVRRAPSQPRVARAPSRENTPWEDEDLETVPEPRRGGIGKKLFLFAMVAAAAGAFAVFGLGVGRAPAGVSSVSEAGEVQEAGAHEEEPGASAAEAEAEAPAEPEEPVADSEPRGVRAVSPGFAGDPRFASPPPARQETGARAPQRASAPERSLDLNPRIPNIDRVTRAIADSSRRKLDSTTKTINAKPPSFRP